MVNLSTDNIHILRLFYTCGMEVHDVTRGDKMTRGRDDQGTKWLGTKWPRDEMTGTKWPGTKWKGTNCRVTRRNHLEKKGNEKRAHTQCTMKWYLETNDHTITRAHILLGSTNHIVSDVDIICAVFPGPFACGVSRYNIGVKLKRKNLNKGSFKILTNY
jgi:hypothetical protein